MPDSDATFHAAIASRDPRFDGRFFSAIVTTGIYCRPICPARTPSPQNIRFYPSAAAAQAAGFRACLRCRPETAPGAPAWTGTAATVTRANRLIREHGLPHGVSGLASRLGVGPRHLHRLFQQHLGAGPKAISQSYRLSTTRLLLTTTDLPMNQVSELAGFNSIRRFNDAVLLAYGRSPSELRKSSPAAGPLKIRLSYRPPFAWDRLLNFLAARAPARVERVVDGVWERVFADSVVRVRNQAEHHRLIAEIPADSAHDLPALVRTLRRVFDLDADPAAIHEVLGRSPLLAPVLERYPGLRIPGAPDGFELVVRAVLGQQISVAGANTLFARVVERWGAPVETGVAGLDRRFPTPAELRNAPFEEVGITGARSTALRGLAAAAAEGSLDLSPRGSMEALITHLCSHRGVGPWTAHYVALRAVGEPDAFPSSDLGLRRAGRDEPVSARALLTEADTWHPWRGYAAITLWNHP